MKRFLIATLGMLVCGVGIGGEGDIRIAMRQSDAGTYYIPVHMEGFGQADLLVDTGSSYTTINEKTLALLKGKGAARYAYEIKGVMADGATKAVPVYVVRSMTIGERCALRDVEVAVFPGESRQILGLSALSKASSFVFSMSPPSLQLSQCGGDGNRGSAPTTVSALP